jgi:iron complex outermembrane receptor protein
MAYAFVAKAPGWADPCHSVKRHLPLGEFLLERPQRYGSSRQISRTPGSASSNFINLDANWRANETLSFFAQFGTSEGDGKTPTQNVSETDPGTGMGAGYTLHGTGSGPSFNLGATNNTTPFPNGVPVTFNWIFGAKTSMSKTRRLGTRSTAILQRSGTWTDLKFGVRYQTHERSSYNAIAQGPLPAGQGTANYPTTWTNYPGDFHTFGGAIPTGVWYWSPEQLAVYNGPGRVNRDPVERAYYQYWFDVEEKNSAAFVQADFKGTNWAANVGLRYVKTDEHVVTFTGSGVTASTPGVITGSLFGLFAGIPVDTPTTTGCRAPTSRSTCTPDLVARFAVAKTMTR